ncbi:MAG: U32 family peptidase [Bacilli bacterium]|nr:U32 family peptidase [Bacilli bacterium]
MEKVELLAPAGDLERLKLAFHYGADACYLGGKDFSLRANAKNFSLEDLKGAAEYAHSLNKKVYVTVNIIFHNEDLDGLIKYLKELEKIKIDAVIVSDLAVVNIINENNINLEVHLSTQASTLNSYAAKFWKDLGVTRIVLAREASREDIKAIKEKTGLDLEVFIHGAMCTSFSGRCVLSNYATNRDSNRGGCAQVCRWMFDIEGSDNTFMMMPKDLCMAYYLKDLIDLGANSFKVEGRMRSVYYVASIIMIYRELIDKIYDNTLTDKDLKYAIAILNRTANRESAPQFFDKIPTYKEQYFNGREEQSNQDFLGIVKEYDEEKGIVTIEQRNYFKKGDIVEFIGPNLETFTYEVNNIYDEDDNLIDIVRHPKMVVKLPINVKLNKDDIMRLKVFDKKDFV